jgi:phosphoadenosine phosphosulfate reductase
MIAVSLIANWSKTMPEASKGIELSEELAAAADGLSPQELLAEAARRFGGVPAKGAGRIALASSFGAEDQVLTDMLQQIEPRVPVFTLDTGRLPQETHDILDATRRRYGIEIEVLCPDREELERMVGRNGTNLFRDSVENRKLCCHVRKVQPLRRKLAQLDAWICGLRREQAPTRGGVQRVQWDEANGLIKLNPLADWTTEQVWSYIRAHDVPYNRLHDQGYPSIGCAPCTRAVEPGQDLRAGRWWWELPEQKECGLHVVAGRLTRKSS